MRWMISGDAPFVSELRGSQRLPTLEKREGRDAWIRPMDPLRRNTRHTQRRTISFVRLNLSSKASIYREAEYREKGTIHCPFLERLSFLVSVLTAGGQNLFYII